MEPPEGSNATDTSAKRLSAALAAVLAIVTCAERVRADPDLGPGAIVAGVRDTSGRPVAGVLVVADGPTQREVTTGPAGIAVLQALPLGTYAIRATRSGYAPTDASVVVLSTRVAPPHTLIVRLVPESLASVGSAASTIAGGTRADAPPDDDLTSRLTADPAVNVVAARNGSSSGAAPALSGTYPDESRVELDGIPVPTDASWLAAFRLRNALGLEGIEVSPGPATTGSSPRDAVGGVLNYVTPGIASAPNASFESGYDSAFGAFEHARFSGTFGNLGVLADAVTSSELDSSQTLKLRYAWAPGASLAYSSYGWQSAAGSVPAYAADLQIPFGSGTLQARTYASAAEITGNPVEHERGVHLAYAVADGENLYFVDFDRSGEITSIANGGTLAGTYTTLDARADVPLSRLARLEFGDAYSGGTSVSARNDPQAALTIHPNSAVTVKLAAGSAFATAPAGAAAPVETAFGYRASVDTAFDPRDRFHVEAFNLTRYDAFGPRADARSSGVEFGFDRTAEPNGFGGLAYVALARTYAYGGPQPPEREFDESASLPIGTQLSDEPDAKERVALEYATKTVGLRFGTTFLGANNALASHAIALGDASLRLRALELVDLRLGFENLYGVVATDPVLAPFYPPRELTLTIGNAAK